MGGNGVISNILLLVRLRKIQRFASETERMFTVCIQTWTRWNKDPSLQHTQTQSLLCPSQLLRHEGLSWSLVDRPSYTALIFSLASSYQRQIASYLADETVSTPTCQCWDPICLKPVLVLCAATVSVLSDVYPSYCVWKMLLPRRHPPPLALAIFLLPLLHRFLSSGGGGRNSQIRLHKFF